MSRTDTIFVTGATGVLGSYLTSLFLKRGYKVFVLAREKNGSPAQKRINSVLKFWDVSYVRDSARLICIEGDLYDKTLTNKIVNSLRNESYIEFFHCAAVTNLYDRRKAELWNVNVEGVKKILQAAAQLKKYVKLCKVNYISTAYVCGDFCGVFTENLLDVGQHFNTFYAWSKFCAEKLVREYSKKQRLLVNIYRPPLIVGYSREGKIFNFKNIYQLIQLCKLQIFNTLPLRSTQIHLVPIDYLAEDIFYLSQNSRIQNACYHPFIERAYSVDTILKTAGNILGFKSPKLCKLNKFYFTKLTPISKFIIQKMEIFMCQICTFNNSFTLRILQNRGARLKISSKCLFKNIALALKGQNESK